MRALPASSVHKLAKGHTASAITCRVHDPLRMTRRRGFCSRPVDVSPAATLHPRSCSPGSLPAKEAERDPDDLLHPSPKATSKPRKEDVQKLRDYAKANKCCDIRNPSAGRLREVGGSATLNSAAGLVAKDFDFPGG